MQNDFSALYVSNVKENGCIDVILFCNDVFYMCHDVEPTESGFSYSLAVGKSSNKDISLQEQLSLVKWSDEQPTEEQGALCDDMIRTMVFSTDDSEIEEDANYILSE